MPKKLPRPSRGTVSLGADLCTASFFMFFLSLPLSHQPSLNLRSVQGHDKVLADECVDSICKEESCQASFAAKRRDVAEAFGATCTRELEHTFVRVLLDLLEKLDEFSRHEF